MKEILTKTILKIAGFAVAFAFLSWAYFNYPFELCLSAIVNGEYIPCNYMNIHSFLNAKYYPLSYAVISLAALAAMIFVFTTVWEHRKNIAKKQTN